MLFFNNNQAFTANLHSKVWCVSGSGAAGDVLPHSGGTKGGRGV